MSQLGRQFECDFTVRNLRLTVKVAQAFPDAEIVSTPSTQISRSHLVAIDLEQGRVKTTQNAQMALYLESLDRLERPSSEHAPTGLILYTEPSCEQVELLEIHKDSITVAEYRTELPPKAELAQQLGEGSPEAREQLVAHGVLLEGDGDE